jgi:putative nucleotidyltransferase with HDIG domain
MLLRTVEDLPSLPPMLWELQAVLLNPRSDAAEIAFVIEKDPGLAATVLRISNSAWYGSSGRVMELREGVARLGSRVLQQVAASALVIDALSGFGTSHGAERFWKHSNRVAFIARTLCDAHPKRTGLQSEAAYTAGLLHDLGKLALDHYFREEYAPVYAWKIEHAGTDAEAERQVLGIDHGEVGAELLELWNLPEELVYGVRFHHAVEEAEVDRRGTPRLICAADAMAHALDEGGIKQSNEAAGDFRLPGDMAVRLFDDLLREEDLVNLLIG